jgi:hypothetical protein
VIADLVLDDRLSSRLFTSEEVFKAEIELIWRRVWVYVGHESEVPHPAAVVQRSVGIDPVSMSRELDGSIAVRTETGAAVSRLASYRGFVFASLAPDGITLEAHLGNAAPYIDRFCDLAPTGRVVITPSVLKTRYFANWKLILDNAVDGYHPVFLHQAMFKSYRGQTPTQWYSDDAGVVNAALGSGHAILDFADQNRKDRGGVLAGVSSSIREGLEREYVAALARRLGEQQARQLTDEGYSNVAIFPNLLLVQQDVRTVEPLSVAESIVFNRAALLEGAPDEINLARVRQQSRSYGPAGVVTPDDFEIFERCQRAFATGAPDWMLLSRGAWREKHNADGTIVGRATDEVGHRGIWRHYRHVMTQPSE